MEIKRVKSYYFWPLLIEDIIEG